MISYWQLLNKKFLMCGLCLLPLGGQAGMYRWVDAKGEVQYSDVVPASAAKQGHSELDEQGMTVKQVPAAPSEAEVAAQKHQETLTKLHKDQQNEQQQRDKYLLANYTSVTELASVFKSKMDLLEKNTASMKERRESLVQRLDAVKKQLDGVKDASQRKTLEGYVSEASETLANYDHALQENQTEQEDLRQHFDKDKQRLNELLSASPSSPHPDLSTTPTTPHEALAHQ